MGYRQLSLELGNHRQEDAWFDGVEHLEHLVGLLQINGRAALFLFVILGA